MKSCLLYSAVAFALLTLCACDDDKDNTENPTSSTISQQSYARAAAVFGSCIPDDGVRRNLNQILYDTNPDTSLTPDAVACLSTASSGCDATLSCAGISIQVVDTPCEASCDGDVWTVCDGVQQFTLDCGKRGATCNVDTGCVASQGAAICGADEEAAACNDETPISCFDGENILGARCIDYGLSCNVSSEFGFDEAQCKGAGEACTSESTGPSFSYLENIVSCKDSETLSLCIGNATHDARCSDVLPGSSCQTAGNSAFCGWGSECDPNTNDATCDGNNIRVCVGGVWETVACSDLGFDSCDDSNSSREAVCK